MFFRRVSFVLVLSVNSVSMFLWSMQGGGAGTAGVCEEGSHRIPSLQELAARRALPGLGSQPNPNKLRQYIRMGMAGVNSEARRKLAEVLVARDAQAIRRMVLAGTSLQGIFDTASMAEKHHGHEYDDPSPEELALQQAARSLDVEEVRSLLRNRRFLYLCEKAHHFYIHRRTMEEHWLKKVLPKSIGRDEGGAFCPGDVVYDLSDFNCKIPDKALLVGYGIPTGLCFYLLVAKVGEFMREIDGVSSFASFGLKFGWNLGHVCTLGSTAVLMSMALLRMVTPVLSWRASILSEKSTAIQKMIQGMPDELGRDMYGSYIGYNDVSY